MLHWLGRLLSIFTVQKCCSEFPFIEFWLMTYIIIFIASYIISEMLCVSPLLGSENQGTVKSIAPVFLQHLYLVINWWWVWAWMGEVLKVLDLLKCALWSSVHTHTHTQYFGHRQRSKTCYLNASISHNNDLLK